MTDYERRQAGVDLLTELKNKCESNEFCSKCPVRDFCLTSPDELSDEKIKNIVDVIMG